MWEISEMWVISEMCNSTVGKRFARTEHVPGYLVSMEAAVV